MRSFGKYLLLFFMLLMIVSCNRKRLEVERIVRKWMGKQIEFPADYQCKVFDRDTSCIDHSGTQFRILSYVDAIGCVSCKMKLEEWKDIMHEADSLMPGVLGFMFFFSPEKEREIIYNLKRDQFNYPVVVDTSDEINKLNKFPENHRFQCFLLDAGNKVVMIGNPVHNPEIWDLYKKHIMQSSGFLPVE